MQDHLRNLAMPATTFRGPLTFSLSRQPSSHKEANASFGILLKGVLLLYDEAIISDTRRFSIEPVYKLDLADYVSVEPGPIQQGLTWELSLQARTVEVAVRPKSSVGVSSDRSKEIKPKNWLRSKLRSKSISAAASFHSLFMTPVEEPFLPSFPNRRVSATSAHARKSSRPVTADPLHRTSLPFAPSSITFSTISKDIQKQWIAALSTNVAAVPSPSPPSHSSFTAVSSLTNGFSAHKLLGKPFQLPGSTAKSDGMRIASSLEVEPLSPQFCGNVESLSKSTAKGKASDTRGANHVDSRLPRWLAEVRNATIASSASNGQTIQRSTSASTLPLGRDLSLRRQSSKIAAQAEMGSASLDNTDRGERTIGILRLGKSLRPPFLRQSTSSSSLSSSRLEHSAGSTAPSSDPPTPKPSLIEFRPSNPVRPYIKTLRPYSGRKDPKSNTVDKQELPMHQRDHQQGEYESRPIAGSPRTEPNEHNQFLTKDFSEIRDQPAKDSPAVGSRIMEPAELRKQMLIIERSLLNEAKRPSTAPSADLSRYTFGTPSPAKGLSATTEFDLQALFAALPPPRRRTVAALKHSSSTSSIAAVERQSSMLAVAIRSID